MCDTTMARKRQDTSYLRKIKKPMIEKKRRDRINSCLSELKVILLDNIKLHGETQTSKLDKADILEMTVSHLRQIQHQQLSVAMATSASVAQQYQEGFVECAKETVRYMDSTRVYPSEMSARIESHLAYSSIHPASMDMHGHTSVPVRSRYSEPSRQTAVRHSLQTTVSRHPTAPVQVMIPAKCETDTSVYDISLCSPADSIELGGEASTMNSSTVSRSNSRSDSESYSTESDSSSHVSVLSVPPRVPVRISSDIGTPKAGTPILTGAHTGTARAGHVLAIPACVPVSISPPQPSQQSVWRPF